MTDKTASAPRARRRTATQWALDRLITRFLKLPKATNTYSVTRDIQVPMRDGTTLLVDVFAPVGRSKGTIMVRSPYGWSTGYSAMSGGGFGSRGYHVVLARARGTFGSGGELEPFQNEVDDGLDTVAWLREQPWFNGKLATYGASYVGFVQWAILRDPPSELVTAIIATAPHDFHDSIWDKGAFNLGLWLFWSERTSRQEVPFLTAIRQDRKRRPLVKQSMNDLPLLDAAERLMPGRAPWYRQWVSEHDPNAPLWTNMDHTEAAKEASIPILLHMGWNDVFLDHMFKSYALLHPHNRDVAMTIGPWTHDEYVTKGSVPFNESIKWFDEHLDGQASSPRGASVKAFVAGSGDEWIDFPAWPPQVAELAQYLTADGGLVDAPSTDEARFTYDPTDPTPSIGGILIAEGGYVDDSSLAGRADVLSFTGAPLTAPLRIVGHPRVELDHASDNPHADLWVRISDVGADGVSHNVTDGFVRLDPATDRIVELELSGTAYEFAAGHRIRLLVGGGSHPRWMRNPGTGEDPALSSRMLPSRRRIRLSDSRLVLPVLRA